MELSSELLSQFAKVTKLEAETPNVGVTVEGTAKLYDDTIYVQLDGSDQLTPVISSTAGMKDGDRVSVLIKDHTAKVTGNTSSPSVSQEDIDNSNQEIADQITEFEIIVAEKASIKDLETESARIDDLVTDNVTIREQLTATEGDIKNLKSENVEISGDLTAQNAEIENLKATKLDADIADIKFATVENLEATNANVHNIEIDYGEAIKFATDQLAANEASIDKLKAEKLSATDADLKYANIDFANIGKAAVENFFSKSGMIGDLVVGEGTITGTLVGVTIKGDLIEGGTVKADKLVVQGEDGLYYKLNVSGETVSTEQTEYNSLNGSIITAKSITAEKVNVNDLVAFGATIGGYKIDESSLYSGTKDSVENTTRGVFMGDDGQFAVGDGTNYLKFFKDSDGNYKLDISASSIRFGSTGNTVEEELEDMVVDATIEYYLSSSSTSLLEGSWDSSSPKWVQGKYIWTRVKTTKKSGDVSYSEPACMTGNNVEVGARNLVLKSNEVSTGDNFGPEFYQIGHYTLSEMPMTVGAVYTVQVNVTNTSERKNLRVCRGGDGLLLAEWDMAEAGTKTYKKTITITEEQVGHEHASNNWIDIYSSTTGETQGDIPIEGTCTINWIKIETGNTATDWSPAPEDIQQNIIDIQNAANEANTKIDQQIPSIEYAKSEVEVLNKSIASLVVDQDGGSLMEQTSDGWQFNIGAIQSSLDQAINDTKEIRGDVSNVTDIVNKTGQLVSDIGKKTAYINMSQDEDGDPVLELGRNDGLFKVRITDTAIEFMEGSQKIAYITNRQLYIQSSVVTDEMKIGASSGYIWKKRGNGNMGLRYIAS